MPRKLSNEEFLERCSERPDYTPKEKYINGQTKILFEHKKCGRTFRMTPAKFLFGRSCPICSKELVSKKLGERGKRRFELALEMASMEVIEPFEYRNRIQKVKVRCKQCGRVQESLTGNIAVGHGCRHCSLVANHQKYDIEEKLRKCAPEWELVGEYKSARTRTQFRHKPCGHISTYYPYNLFVNPDACPSCNASIPEKEVRKWVESLGVGVVSHDRTVLEGKELDIYVPSKNVAIEFNGCYWHSARVLAKNKKMSYAEAKKYHYLKSFWCEKAGIRLIHVWDYEWADERKQKVLKNIILGALGMLPERYYARQTVCKHYVQNCERWQELNNFFAENNIQGNRGGSHVFTLEDKDGRILMAYKFGRPSGGKAKKLYEYEMVRGASAPGVQVVGGASKLWKHFVDTLHPNSVVYYIDYNYFDGRSVEKLGGKFITSQPGVKNYWTKSGEVKNREPAHHKKVREAIEKGECLELWNAGTKTYVFTFNCVSQKVLTQNAPS